MILPTAFATVLAGFLAWTLIEYAGHRWGMHGTNSSVLARSHRAHHQAPDDLSIRGSFVYGSVALFAIAGSAAITSLILGQAAWYLALGFSIGVLSYIVSHWITHLAAGSTRLRAPWAAHLRHHAGHPDTNFGFSTSMWDRVFGTYLE